MGGRATATVKISVGTAASTMPRRPPSAVASWRRTTASTVSTRRPGGCSAGVGRHGQLVAGVVHDADAVLDADPAL